MAIIKFLTIASYVNTAKTIYFIKVAVCLHSTQGNGRENRRQIEYSVREKIIACEWQE